MRDTQAKEVLCVVYVDTIRTSNVNSTPVVKGISSLTIFVGPSMEK
jgi:hypothetical protein